MKYIKAIINSARVWAAVFTVVGFICACAIHNAVEGTLGVVGYCALTVLWFYCLCVSSAGLWYLYKSFIRHQY